MKSCKKLQIKNDFSPISDVPGAPGRPEPLETSEEAITLQWTRPINDGGAPIQGYVIEKREVGTGEWTKAAFGTIPDTKHRVSCNLKQTIQSEIYYNIGIKKLQSTARGLLKVKILFLQITGLTTRKEYEFRIAAVNAAGQGKFASFVFLIFLILFFISIVKIQIGI